MIGKRTQNGRALARWSAASFFEREVNGDSAEGFSSPISEDLITIAVTRYLFDGVLAITSVALVRRIMYRRMERSMQSMAPLHCQSSTQSVPFPSVLIAEDGQHSSDSNTVPPCMVEYASSFWFNLAGSLENTKSGGKTFRTLVEVWLYFLRTSLFRQNVVSYAPEDNLSNPFR